MSEASAAVEPTARPFGSVARAVLLAAVFSAGFACGFSAASPKLSTPASSLLLPLSCNCPGAPGPTPAAITEPCSAPPASPAAPTSPTSTPHPSTSTSPTPTFLATSTAQGAELSSPMLVKVFAGGNGRLGNNIGQLLHGLAFAVRSHADKVQLVASGGQLPQIFQFKNLTVDLPDAGSERGKIPKECTDTANGARMKKEPNTYASGFWTTRCLGVPAKEYHNLALQYIWPLLKQEVQSCLQQDEPSKRLVVHLRGQDLWNMNEFEQTPKGPIKMEAGAHHWLWANPPCTMYEKIIREENFQEVLVVTSPDMRHACVAWFQNLNASLDVKVTVQAKSLAEDFCTLAQAKHLVLSFSTLSNAAAALSKRLEKVYVRQFAHNSLLNCQVWPGVSVVQYAMPITEQHHEPYNNTYAGVIEWLGFLGAGLLGPSMPKRYKQHGPRIKKQGARMCVCVWVCGSVCVCVHLLLCTSTSFSCYL
ncbi:unnamed protein product [Effrenium voratum]|nr:unnamed protein product [Effrenium voratum]